MSDRAPKVIDMVKVGDVVNVDRPDCADEARLSICDEVSPPWWRFITIDGHRFWIHHELASYIYNIEIF